MAKNELLGPWHAADPLTKRKCRVCGKRLRESRYFTHRSCGEADHSNGVYGAEEWGYGFLGVLSETTNCPVSDMAILEGN